MRSSWLRFLMLSVVLTGMYGCVSTVQNPSSSTMHRETQAKDLDPCQGQTRFEDETSEIDNPADTSIRLLSITPQAGSVVGENSALKADLAYTVRDFQMGQFKIMAQFDTNSEGTTTDGAFKNHPLPDSASGHLHFCFPLRYVWNLPNIKRPLTVRFLLNRVYESGISQPIARTDVVSFPVVEGTTSSNTQETAVTSSVKYDSALLSVYSTFEYYVAAHLYCTRQFPELAPEISKNFEEWTKKYSNVKAEINSLLLNWATARTGGDSKKAEQMISDVRQMGAPDFQQDTLEQSRNKCRGVSSFIASPGSDPESMLASQLAVIRQGVNSIKPH